METIKRKTVHLIRATRVMYIINRLVTLIYSIKVSLYILFGKTDIEAIYNNRFFKRIDQLTAPSAKNVIRILYDEFKPRSVLDVGCGTGIYLSHFKEKGVSVLGVDASDAVLEKLKINRDEIIISDIRKGFKPPKKYNLCICLELAEHIPKSNSKALVEILTDSSDTIVFTAAPPGQGGQNHINEQKREFWIKLFWDCGFYYETAITNKIAQQFQHNHVLWYLEKNLFIFKKKN